MPDHLSTDREGRKRLRRDFRLRDAKDFRRVQRRGRRQAGRYFVLVRAEGFEEGNTRLGLAVGRKIGNAVARNHVKRRVREWFRQSRPWLPEGEDMVVIARKGAAARSAAEIAEELSELTR